MFQFPGSVSNLAMYSPDGASVSPLAGFPHSDIPGSMLTYSSPRRFAVLSRPSSTPSAKASSVRPYSLNLF